METITQHEAYERYNDMIDECVELINIFGMKYNPSRVLSEIDPIAYECGFDEWCDGEEQEGNFKVDEDSV